MDGETKAQRGAMSDSRSHSKSSELGLESKALASGVCLSLALHRSSLNTYSSTFRSRESHHTSLTTGTRGTWGSGTTILTSGTLRVGNMTVVRTEGRQTGGGDGHRPRGRHTHRGTSFAIRTRAAGAASQTLWESRGVT